MNELFQQLADQAEKYADDNFKGEHFWTQAYESKFAELIVRECIDIAGEEDFDVMMKEGYPCSQTAKKIKEHFGVKE